MTLLPGDNVQNFDEHKKRRGAHTLHNPKSLPQLTVIMFAKMLVAALCLLAAFISADGK
jgi:hypothetical protein